MKDVSRVHLIKHLDVYAHQQNPNYAPTTLLYNALRDTMKAKGLILYYYPLPLPDETDGTTNSEDSWIGWHNDSGFLTCLAGRLVYGSNDGPTRGISPTRCRIVCGRSSLFQSTTNTTSQVTKRLHGHPNGRMHPTLDGPKCGGDTPLCLRVPTIGPSVLGVFY